MMTEIALILMILFVLGSSLLFAAWNISFLVKNFGTKESRRLYDVTH